MTLRLIENDGNGEPVLSKEHIEVVAVLEDFAERARRGEFHSVGLVVLADDHFETAMTGNELGIVGGLRYLEQGILDGTESEYH